MKSKYNVTVFLFLIIFWLILSPLLNIQSILIGSIASILIVFYARDIAFTNKEIPKYSLKNLVIYVKFVLRLLVEIVKANIEVALIVLNPKLPLSQCFIKVPLKINNDIVKVIYGNAVTLTPGTLTVDVEEDGFLIHALTKDAADGMTDSIIEHYCTKMDDIRD
ncbi:Na+/H+ antiporter subunit E [Serpentinicella sp. ANB-PHB4]|uniref:Na+/H+ antiporter subunit E n=1 Tax=Serpentinicella sp. ANB-PHB4 TaxID=3074076 RepID=UPI0028556F91|nr:Na+/H+ antiporter subunit E [Serpentinicella sp. ANB-PHB4]MDR5659336.1 Na+/H+ antiporter subunit E [Serpentinicella sp. ANB-PHB4]